MTDLPLRGTPEYWQRALGDGAVVVMDNDDWHFEVRYADTDSVVVLPGGSGPYGLDLLVHLLEKHYNGLEMV
jgi:hypothetical protein